MHSTVRLIQLNYTLITCTHESQPVLINFFMLFDWAGKKNIHVYLLVIMFLRLPINLHMGN